MTDKIPNFIGQYYFLSNQYGSTVYLDGVPYPTIEHAYQASKTTSDSQRETIRRAKDPHEAKKLGRAVPLRPDWEDVRLSMMRDFVRQKFTSPFLQHMLLATGDAELIHGNGWNDIFFGVSRGRGQNWLGKILMEVREEIRPAPPEAP